MHECIYKGILSLFVFNIINGLITYSFMIYIYKKNSNTQIAILSSIANYNKSIVPVLLFHFYFSRIIYMYIERGLKMRQRHTFFFLFCFLFVKLTTCFFIFTHRQKHILHEIAYIFHLK